MKKETRPLAGSWIAVDWGTSNLRAWHRRSDGSVLARAGTDQGVSRMQAADEFEPVLLDLIRDWLCDDQVVQVIACGMIGSRSGWRETPYLTISQNCAASALHQAPGHDERISLWIVSGLKQENPVDVMRGEETQIMGFISKNPDYCGTLCLSGTHTKWVDIQDGRMIGFNTSMTGELYYILGKYSVLARILKDGGNMDAFKQAVLDAYTTPQALSRDLFSLRAGVLLDYHSPESARMRLSGLLIGGELAAMEKYWLDKTVTIIGADKLSRRYQTALEMVGCQADIADVEEMTLCGLAAYRDQLIMKDCY